MDGVPSKYSIRASGQRVSSTSLTPRSIPASAWTRRQNDGRKEEEKETKKTLLIVNVLVFFSAYIFN
jgi:hypothetical protein